jgi:hypothetical protein
MPKNYRRGYIESYNLAVQRDLGKGYATQWRRELELVDLKAQKESFRGIWEKAGKPRTFQEIKALADNIIDGPEQFAVLQLGLTLMMFNQEWVGQIITRWRGLGQPRIRDFAPYFTHILTVDLFFYLSIAAGLIGSDRKSIRLANPLAAYGMQLAVFLQRELVTPHRLELGAFVETLAGRNITLLDGVIHHRAEDGHFKPDGGIADKRNRFFFGRFDLNRLQNPDAERVLHLSAALGFVVRKGLGHLVADLPNAVALVAARAVHSPPCRVATPKLITNEVNLSGAYISA